MIGCPEVSRRERWGLMVFWGLVAVAVWLLGRG